MSELIFYKNIQGINQDQHKTIKVKSCASYAFARPTNFIPLAGVEFSLAVKEYPIFFVKAENGDYAPGVLVGLLTDNNLMVNEDGAWDARYIPAFVRRYPFVSSFTDDKARIGVCIDVDYEGFDAGDGGEPLFNEDGSQAPMLEQATELLKDYHNQTERTQIFCRRMVELDLFKKARTEIKDDQGKSLAINGLWIIDEQKILALPDDQALELFRSGELAWIYNHLASLDNLKLLASRLVARKD